MGKRKVIQIADSTQLVSLPRKWALKNNIKKGDELEVTDDGSRLIVDSGGQSSGVQKKKTINLNDMEPFLKYILHALYQKGYSEVTFIYNDEKVASSLHQSLYDEMIGFEVVEQTLNSSTIRAVAGALSSEFDTMISRSFQIVLSMFEGIVDVFHTGNLLPIKSLTYMESSTRKYAGFCKRMINRQLLHSESITYLYVVVIRIERLARNLKLLCFEMMRLPNEIKSMDSEILSLFDSLHSLLKEAHGIYHNYDFLKTLQVFEKIRKTRSDAHEYLRSNNGQQIRFLHYIFNIAENIDDSLRAKMQMEI